MASTADTSTFDLDVTIQQGDGAPPASGDTDNGCDTQAQGDC
ncbi:hypothetical protein [Rhizohabitans arisaemae]|nr:hypothetical protein [Rhizohabitans arisaemae]